MSQDAASEILPFWTPCDPMNHIFRAPNLVHSVHISKMASAAILNLKMLFCTLVTHVSPISIHKPNLVQIGQELAKIHTFVFF